MTIRQITEVLVMQRMDPTPSKGEQVLTQRTIKRIKVVAIDFYAESAKVIQHGKQKIAQSSGGESAL